MDNQAVSSQRVHNKPNITLNNFNIMQLFSWTPYAHKVNHTHGIHSLNMKLHFHSYLQVIPADDYQHVSTLVSCKRIHLHQSGSLFQFLLQLKVFHDNEAASDWLPRGLCPESFLQNPLVTFDHEKSISYIHRQPTPLMSQGIILTEQQEIQAHLTGPVRQRPSQDLLYTTVNNIYGDFWQTFL